LREQRTALPRGIDYTLDLVHGRKAANIAVRRALEAADVELIEENGVVPGYALKGALGQNQPSEPESA